MKAILLTAVLLFHADASGQVNSFSDRQKSVSVGVRPEIKNIFNSIEKGVASGSIPSFSTHFAPQVFVNISGQNEGYFSANQTVAVLQNYLMTLRPVSFSFSRFQEKGENPYATGRLMYVSKGSQESVQVYVSLALHDSKWVISQFNVY
ncbi:MAG: DUF4783 domain-containing protein [Ignavibacteriales bacterium]|nr:DUF4783 domain-containing protein [Ignavibacteriales bacterium]